MVPVPLHAKKLKSRGYNQVAGFAQKLAHHLEAEYVPDVLIKNTNTKTQTKKNRATRWQNDTTLYTLTDSDRLAHKNILLVDDIITTGATMEICARTLNGAPGVTIYLTSMATVPNL